MRTLDQEMSDLFSMIRDTERRLQSGKTVSSGVFVGIRMTAAQVEAILARDDARMVAQVDGKYMVARVPR